ncbi:hypothetical protein DM01DRAFT_1013497 [Hesseltinella vesiculosa]|uniref:Uncharacterized protein n=1 Tax=Hesseltinella vesiculosa TaxID=101127 RepID=A0A1X2GYJ5_9FUNG|nr:hypothetical protein DM01DRAFT_1013497 [Hesseltinella vesiculosa]
MPHGPPSPAPSSVVSHMDDDQYRYDELEQELLDEGSDASHHPRTASAMDPDNDPLFDDYPSSTRGRIDRSIMDEFIPNAWREDFLDHVDHQCQQLQDVMDERFSALEEKLEQTEAALDESKRAYDQVLVQQKDEQDRLLERLDDLVQWQGQNGKVCARHQALLKKMDPKDQRLARILAQWITKPE